MRLVLGGLNTLTPDEARKLAASLLAKVKLGGDPAAERSQARKSENVAELLDLFISNHIRVWAYGQISCREADDPRMKTVDEFLETLQCQNVYSRQVTIPDQSPEGILTGDFLTGWGDSRADELQESPIDQCDEDLQRSARAGRGKRLQPMLATR